MTGRRSYRQNCSLALALDIVGERWTLLIVRDLLLGSLRYGDIIRGLPGITTNLLAKRLKEMEAAGLIERVRRSAGVATSTYQLTALGRALEPAIHALGSWAPAARDERNLEWLLVALRRRYLGGRQLVAEFVADEVPYRFNLTATTFQSARGSAESPALRVRGGPAEIARLFRDGPTEEALSGVQVQHGNETLLKQLLLAFRRSD